MPWRYRVLNFSHCSHITEFYFWGEGGKVGPNSSPLSVPLFLRGIFPYTEHTWPQITTLRLAGRTGGLGGGWGVDIVPSSAVRIQQQQYDTKTLIGHGISICYVKIKEGICTNFLSIFQCSRMCGDYGMVV